MITIQLDGGVKVMGSDAQEMVAFLKEFQNSGRKSYPRRKEDGQIRQKRSRDGLVGSYWLCVHYGISQREQTEVRKLFEIKNHGTSSNPRYSSDDAQLIIDYWAEKNKTNQ